MGDIRSTQDVSIYDNDDETKLCIPTADSAAKTNGIHLLGTDGTNARILKTNVNGELIVNTPIVAGTQIQVRDEAGTSNDVGFQTSFEQSVPVVIADYNSPTNRVTVDTSGRLLVSSPPPTAPPATNPVVITAFGGVTSTSDTLYTITSGTTLFLQRFNAGGEVETTAGHYIALYEDPNGDLSVLNLIDVIFASGSSTQHDLSQSFTGDGTRRILLRRVRLSGGSKQVFGRWEGYEG